MFQGVDLEERLKRTKQRRIQKKGDELSDAIRNLLLDVEQKDTEILQRVFASGSVQNDENAPPLSDLDPQRIYHLSDIKSICVDYRLRFLAANRFKGSIPVEAIREINRIECDADVELSSFRIVAPAELFRLDEKDKDPMLFMPLNNGYYYLIHKWGGELNPMRKILSYPLQNFYKLAQTIFWFTLAVTLLLPHSILVTDPSHSDLGIRVIFFFWLLLALSGMSAFFIMANEQNFNEDVWNSKFRA